MTEKQSYHFHLLDGSSFNDHRSIGDYYFKTLDEAIEFGKTFFKEYLYSGLEVDNSSDAVLIYHPSSSFEDGYEYAVSIEVNF